MSLLNADSIRDETVNVALQATCQRSKCGSIIVQNGAIIGKGYNSPPDNIESQRRCQRKGDLRPGFKSDRTCCVHAEQRAIMDALAHNPQQLRNASLYFIRLDQHNLPMSAGQPYCTICSKMALDVGITQFNLWRDNRWHSYQTQVYNDLSFAYDGQ